jgi:hypothetical protein
MMAPDKTGFVTVAHFDATGTLVRENVSLDDALDLIDPPKPLTEEFRTELLALCAEADEQIAKIGMVRFHAFLRADLDALVETLRDRPVSIADAREVANEYIRARDTRPPDVDAEPEEPTAGEIATQGADARARGLLTLREAMARWNLENAGGNPIGIDDLDADDRANIDVRAYYQIGAGPESVSTSAFADAVRALPADATHEEIFTAAQTLRSQQKPPGSAKAR